MSDATAPKVEATEKARFTATINADLAAFLKTDRFKNELERGEYWEFALTEYAKSKGYSPKLSK